MEMQELETTADVCPSCVRSDWSPQEGVWEGVP